ncbi:T9SS type A sorting domain-containing protein [Tenacibaculum sp. 190524A05c]|uniref:T9SS type A sorting domain-containing protein n=1 Tax=Tenacibaculum platacis TaxID=3137852 RepID=UPI0031FB44C9
MRKKYILKLITFIFFIGFNYHSSAQLNVTTANVDNTINFDGTIPGVNEGVFQAVIPGPSSTPVTGQLDSNAWEFVGFSNGPVLFDGTAPGTDYYRGGSTGGTSSGGLYAFETSTGDFSLGIQGTGSDFTPGTVALKITNNTGSTVTSIDVSYEIWVLNDQARANSFNFSYSTDNVSYTSVAALDFTSTEAADLTPAWTKVDRTTTITGVNIANGGNLFIRWSSDDVSGGGSRDEFGLDDIVVNMAGPLTWTGTTNNDWATTTNWDSGSVPGATDNVIIPSGLTNYPTISSAVTVNTMSIASGASLIANATVTGDVTYTRSLGTTNWYLVSSPVSGEDMTDMRANNSFKTNGSSEISFAPYDNSQAVANDRWAYFSNTAADALVNGKGYSASLSAAGNISFTGSINSGDVMIALTQGGGSGTNFNLLGNPYTAFVNSATFLTAESGDLASETIWLWNQATSSYETKVTADAFKIAPGQGFFVEANSTNNVSFTGAMQSHEASDTFQRSSRPEVQLYVNDGSNSRYAKLYYINGTTTGFDNGYDGKLFNGLTNSFAVYTHLLSDSQGDNYQVQSLPTSDIETMVVPVGLIADSNKEITFSVNTKNLPQGVNVYLEDRLNNTFVNLSEDDHTITTTSAVNGIGQYYLHTTSARLSNDDIAQDLANVSIYRSANNEITVAGLQSEANVKVFSLLGEELVNTDINSNGLSKIALPNLSTGVYVVKLNSVLGNITKKIILE